MYYVFYADGHTSRPQIRTWLTRRPHSPELLSKLHQLSKWVVRLTLDRSQKPSRDCRWLNPLVRGSAWACVFFFFFSLHVMWRWYIRWGGNLELDLRKLLRRCGANLFGENIISAGGTYWLFVKLIYL